MDTKPPLFLSGSPERHAKHLLSVFVNIVDSAPHSSPRRFPSFGSDWEEKCLLIYLFLLFSVLTWNGNIFKHNKDKPVHLLSSDNLCRFVDLSSSSVQHTCHVIPFRLFKPSSTLYTSGIQWPHYKALLTYTIFYTYDTFIFKCSSFFSKSIKPSPVLLMVLVWAQSDSKIVF